MIGEQLKQLGSRLHFAVVDLAGDLDPLRRRAGPVRKRAFQRQIDEAGDLVAVADRDLARDQRRYAHRLERGQHVADAPAGLVDAVDEDQVGNAKLVEHPERGRGQRGAGRVGIDHDDREIGDRNAACAVGGKTDRSGTIEQGEMLAEIVEMHRVEFGRSAARPCFGGRITDRVRARDRALAIDRSGGEQHRLGQAGLSRAGRSDQRDNSSAVDGSRHGEILSQGAGERVARMSGCALQWRQLPPVVRAWQEGPVASERRPGAGETSLKSHCTGVCVRAHGCTRAPAGHERFYHQSCPYRIGLTKSVCVGKGFLFLSNQGDQAFRKRLANVC